MNQEALWAKFWGRVEVTGFCWNWRGALNSRGYGAVRRNNKLVSTHREAYKYLVGEIPEGLVLDHLCRNIICLNPDHLEPVTTQENTRRGFSIQAVNMRKRTCPVGHEYTASSNGFRRCYPCGNARNNERRRKKRLEKLTA